MKYRLTRTWGSLLTGFGVVLFLVFIGGGILMFLASPIGASDHLSFQNKNLVQVLALFLFPVVGFVLSAPFIVLGQLVRVFLDQRRLLVRIHSRFAELDDRVSQYLLMKKE